jgi:hypothetical protein
METNSKFYIECVSNNGMTYFQVVRRSDEAILSAYQSLTRAADRLCEPVYKDGTPVVL